MRENHKSNQHKNAAIALIDLVPDSLLIIDTVGKIVAAGGADGTCPGYKGGELVGKAFLKQSFGHSQDSRFEFQEPLSRLCCQLSQNLKLEVKTFG